MPDARKLFIAATHQNNGKTMLALGLLGNLRLRQQNVAYIKPVGQRTVAADGIIVDEDALLMERVYHFGNNLQDMNPVTVGKGFTADWIEHVQTNVLEDRILQAYARVSEGRDFMVIEGTGHAGVGSVFNLSNARVAKLLQAPVVMVAPGGVGRPIDEVALNRELLVSEGVELAGVVINKVQVNKYEQVRELATKGFARLGIKVLGVLPYDEVLPAPTIKEVLEEVGGELISGHENDETLDVLVTHFLVGAMSTHQALDYIKPGSLVITPGDREDIVLAAIGMTFSDRYRQADSVAGIMLTGMTLPHAAILELLRRSRIPAMVCPKDTYTVASQIHDLMAKIRPTDKAKIEHATRLVGQYFDFAAVCPECG
jgi:BioD-like phosphotransacetylase family protein